MKPEMLRNGISASDAAMTLGVAPAMAKEYLLAAEGKGMPLTILLRCSFDDFLIGFHLQACCVEMSVLMASVFTSICLLNLTHKIYTCKSKI